MNKTSFFFYVITMKYDDPYNDKIHNKIDTNGKLNIFIISFDIFIYFIKKFPRFYMKNLRTSIINKFKICTSILKA